MYSNNVQFGARWIRISREVTPRPLDPKSGKSLALTKVKGLNHDVRSYSSLDSSSASVLTSESANDCRKVQEM